KADGAELLASVEVRVNWSTAETRQTRHHLYCCWSASLRSPRGSCRFRGYSVRFAPVSVIVPTRALAFRWSTCRGQPARVLRTSSVCRPVSMLTSRPRPCSRRRGEPGAGVRFLRGFCHARHDEDRVVPLTAGRLTSDVQRSLPAATSGTSSR